MNDRKIMTAGVREEFRDTSGQVGRCGLDLVRPEVLLEVDEDNCVSTPPRTGQAHHVGISTRSSPDDHISSASHDRARVTAPVDHGYAGAVAGTGSGNRSHSSVVWMIQNTVNEVTPTTSTQKSHGRPNRAATITEARVRISTTR